VKQTSTPPATNVRTRLSAPFIVSLPSNAPLRLMSQINHCSPVSSKVYRNNAAIAWGVLPF
jgi:hypothetical protein